MSLGAFSACALFGRELRVAALLVVAFGLVACERTPAPPDPLHIVILHTNDLHGQVAPRVDRARGPGALRGGFPALARVIRREREAARADGKEVLLLDAGDLFQGTPEGNLTRGRIVTDFLNALEYDAVTIGNHEYDYGRALVVELDEALNPPFLGANVRYAESGRQVTNLDRVFSTTLGGVPVNVIGLTTSAMKDVTVEEATRGLVFEREEDTVARELAELGVHRKGQAVNILLNHIGLDRDIALAMRFPVIDAIVGGHSHTPVDRPVRVGDTIIGQAGSKGLWLGRLELIVDRRTRRVLSAEGKLLTVEADRIAGEPDIEALCARYAPRIGAIMDRVVGVTRFDLLRGQGPVSTSIGNFITDAMRAETGSDVAFQNRGGIRCDILEGPITVRHLYELSPFGNTLVSMTLTGAQIVEAMETSLATDHSFLEMSGMRCRHDSRQPAGSRVLEITVGKDHAPLELTKRYRVTVNSFLSRGGDKYAVFRHGADVVDHRTKLRDAEQRFIEVRKSLVPDLTKRLLDIAPPLAAKESTP